MAMETAQGLKRRPERVDEPWSRPIRHVVWDWNGTLFDDTLLCMEIINGLLGTRGGRTVGLAQYREVFGFPVKDYYIRLGFDFRKESWERVSREFIDAYEARRHECRLREGAREALAACAAAGVGQSILSAYRRHTLEEIVEHFGLGRFFEHLAGLDNHYADGKLETGRALVSRLRTPTEEVLFVGDTEHDWEVAAALGMRCVLLAGGHHSERRLKACGVPVVHSLSRIPCLLSPRN
jgi:phosphoglycolate phosphatase